MSLVLKRLHEFSDFEKQLIAVDTGAIQVSYSELSKLVQGAARLLRRAGVQRAGIAGDNSLEWIIADLACIQANVVAVPIPAFFSPSQMNHLFQSAGLDAILVAADLEEESKAETALKCIDARGEWASTTIPGCSLLLCRPVSRATLSGVEQFAPCGTQKITFTSGSTGEPKGVCLSYSSIESTALSLARVVCGSGVSQHLSVLPYATLLENVAGIYVPLLLGATIHVRKMEAIGLNNVSEFDPFRFLQTLNECKPESMILVPQLLMALVTLKENKLPLPDSLSFIAVGGGKVSASLLERAAALNLPVYEGYGLSESGSVVALNDAQDLRSGSVGKPLSHVKVKVDASGEVWVSGANMLGYLGEKPETREWIPTGDLGQMDSDGFLIIQGRKKNVMITGFGRNVSPEWLESELTQQVEIKQAAVYGGESRVITAVVVPRYANDHKGIERALARVNERLPQYATIKRMIVSGAPFSFENGLATANGRIKRSAIEAEFSKQLLASELSYQPAHNAFLPKNDSAAVTEQSSDVAFAITSNNDQTNCSVPMGSGSAQTFSIYKGENMTFFEKLQIEVEADKQYLMSAPVIAAVSEGRLDLNSYIYFLKQAFHHVKHTVPLMMACGAKLDESKEWVRKALVEYINEEYGHHEWILKDLETCGVDAEAVRKENPGTSIDMMVAYLYDTINRRNPMGFFGMVQVLEGTSINLAIQLGKIVQQKLGLPDEAFSYLYSHGELDIEHIEFFKGLMNNVQSVEDQNAIVEATKRCYQLYGGMLREIPLPAASSEVKSHAA